MHGYQEPSHWTPTLVQQRIDPVLLQNKQLEISHEMQQKSVAARHLASKPGDWAKVEVEIADEWAEKLLEAWKEIWEIQGFPESHAFYRAIYDYALVQLFAARRSVFEGKCQRNAKMNRRPDYRSGVLRSFAQQMDKLHSKWNRRMNVESRKALYSAKRDPHSVSDLRLSDSIARAWNGSSTKLPHSPSEARYGGEQQNHY